jgi:hypothetical protein
MVEKRRSLVTKFIVMLLSLLFVGCAFIVHPPAKNSEGAVTTKYNYYFDKNSDLVGFTIEMTEPDATITPKDGTKNSPPKNEPERYKGEYLPYPWSNEDTLKDYR